MHLHHDRQSPLDFGPADSVGAAPPILIGCAGWSVSGREKDSFPLQGSHLERYASVLPAVEINTSFYRPHKPETYARWRDSVPNAFRFSVKLPREITHHRRLRDADDALLKFLDGVGNLGEKFGCLLIQLPPSLEYDSSAASDFLARVRGLLPPKAVDVACEPRHATWFTREVAELFSTLKIARVRADPAIVMKPAPMRYNDVEYIRLHGSPEIYRSSYPAAYLAELVSELANLRQEGRRAWCVFDNTADGAALSNALTVLTGLSTGNLSF